MELAEPEREKFESALLTQPLVGIRIRWVELTVIDGRPLFGNTGRIKHAYGIWKGPVGVS
jgi:hypothetical protein